MEAPRSQPCEPGSLTCIDTRVPDSQIATGLWVWSLVGATCLLLFSAVRPYIKTYSTRLHLPNLTHYPAGIPGGRPGEGGWRGAALRFVGWAVPVFTATDGAILQTAGLDALMLTWTARIGMQIFGPLTVVGLAVLLPVNLVGQGIRLGTAAAISASQNGRDAPPPTFTSFSKFTLTNLPKGSPLYWVAWAYVWAASAYIMWLLRRYYRAYIVLRQRYLTGGEDGVARWHEAYLERRREEAAAAEAAADAARKGSGGLAGGGPGGVPAGRRPSSPGGAGNAAGRALAGAGAGVVAALRSAFALSDELDALEAAEGDGLGGGGGGGGGAGRRPASGASGASGATAAAAPAGAGVAGAAARQAARLSSLDRARGHSFGARPRRRPYHSERGEGGGGAAGLRRRTGSGGEDGSIGGGGAGGAPPPARPPSAPAVPASPPHHRHSHHFAVPGALPPEPAPPMARGGDEEEGGGEEVGARPPPAARRHGPCPPPSATAAAAAGLDDAAATLPLAPKAIESGPVSRLETAPPPGEAGRERPLKWWAAGQDDGSDDEGGGEGGGRVSDGRGGGGGGGARGDAAALSAIVAAKPSVYDRKRINTTVVEEVTTDEDEDELVAEAVAAGSLPPGAAKTRGGAAAAAASPPARRPAATTRRTRTVRVSVAAQQYAVLVMDVPDLVAERAAARARAARAGAAGPLGRAAAAVGACLSHTILGKPRVAVSAEVLAAARDRAAARGGGGQRLAGRSRSPSPTRRGAAEDATAAAAASTTSAFAPVAGSRLRTGASVEELLDDDVPIEPLAVVEETFRRLFPDTFLRAVPVYKHKDVDLLLLQWDRACDKLEALEAVARRRKRAAAKAIAAAAAKAAAKAAASPASPTAAAAAAAAAAASAAPPPPSAWRPVVKTRWCGLAGPAVDALDAAAARVRALERAVVAARAAALAARPSPSYFVFFSSQRDAAIASQAALQAEDGTSFRVLPAPGPEDVCWSTLWLRWAERDWRRLAALPLIAAIMILPIGFFTGAAFQLPVYLCRASGLKGTGLCTGSGLRIAATIISPLLLTLYQGLILPQVLYWVALAEGQHVALSAMDRRIARLYFVWDVANVFLGFVAGGSLLFELGTVIKEPAAFPARLGSIVPQVSNYLINYLVLQGFALVPLRFLFPHPGVLGDLVRLAGFCRARTPHDRADVLWPHSVRYGKEVGALLLVFVMALAYAATAPPILPIAFLYFAGAWAWWRYSVLYVWERAYESGGRLFDVVFSSLVWCLFIFAFFTGCIFLSSGAYAQATTIWFVLIPLIYSFDSSLKGRYGATTRAGTPLEAAAAAPPADVPPEVYTPPALRPRAAGWHPEAGKAWEGWKAPMYAAMYSEFLLGLIAADLPLHG